MLAIVLVKLPNIARLARPRAPVRDRPAPALRPARGARGRPAGGALAAALRERRGLGTVRRAARACSWWPPIVALLQRPDGRRGSGARPRHRDQAPGRGRGARARRVDVAAPRAAPRSWRGGGRAGGDGGGRGALRAEGRGAARPRRRTTAPSGITRCARSRPTTSGTCSTASTSACAASLRVRRASIRDRIGPLTPSRRRASCCSPPGPRSSWPASGAGRATAGWSWPPPSSSSPCSCCRRRCTSGTSCPRPSCSPWSRRSRRARVCVFVVLTVTATLNQGLDLGRAVLDHAVLGGPVARGRSARAPRGHPQRGDRSWPSSTSALLRVVDGRLSARDGGPGRRARRPDRPPHDAPRALAPARPAAGARSSRSPPATGWSRTRTRS